MEQSHLKASCGSSADSAQAGGGPGDEAAAGNPEGFVGGADADLAVEAGAGPKRRRMRRRPGPVDVPSGGAVANLSGVLLGSPVYAEMLSGGEAGESVVAEADGPSIAQVPCGPSSSSSGGGGGGGPGDEAAAGVAGDPRRTKETSQRRTSHCSWRSGRC